MKSSQQLVINFEIDFRIIGILARIEMKSGKANSSWLELFAETPFFQLKGLITWPYSNGTFRTET